MRDKKLISNKLWNYLKVNKTSNTNEDYSDLHKVKTESDLIKKIYVSLSEFTKHACINQTMAWILVLWFRLFCIKNKKNQFFH